MLTQRNATLTGLAIVIAMALLLILVWFKLVPESWYVFIFLFALLLFLMRITLHLVIARQRRLSEAQRKEEARNGPKA